MAVVNLQSDGSYYIFFKRGGTEKLVKAKGNYTGMVFFGVVHFPAELVGHKVRFKVELVKEEKN